MRRQAVQRGHARSARLRPMVTDRSSDRTEHITENRGYWDDVAHERVSSGEKAWAGTQPTLGMWEIPGDEVDLIAEDLTGIDVIELGCGTAYWAVWLALLGCHALAMVCQPLHGSGPASTSSTTESSAPRTPPTKSGPSQVPTGRTASPASRSGRSGSAEGFSPTTRSGAAERGPSVAVLHWDCG